MALFESRSVGLGLRTLGGFGPTALVGFAWPLQDASARIVSALARPGVWFPELQCFVAGLGRLRHLPGSRRLHRGPTLLGLR